MSISIWDTRFSSSKAVTFDEALKMSGMSLDEWITMNGSHVLLGEEGEILGGLGGKFKNLSDVPRNTIKQREGESDRAFQRRAKKELGITSSKKTTDKKQKAEAVTKQKDKGEAKPKKEIKATPEQKEQYERHYRDYNEKGISNEDKRNMNNVQNLTDEDMKPRFPGDYSKVGMLKNLQYEAKEKLNFAKAPWGLADNPLIGAKAQEMYDNVTEKLERAKEIYNEEKKNWPDDPRTRGLELAIRNMYHFAEGKHYNDTNERGRTATTNDITNYEPDYFGQKDATFWLDHYIKKNDGEIKYIEKKGTDDGTYQTKYYLEALKMKNDELKDYREKVLAHNREFEKEQWPEKYAAREKEEQRAERAARKDERQRKKEGYSEREWAILKEYRANDKNDKDKRRYHLYTSDYLSGNGKGHIVKPEEVFKIGKEHGINELYVRGYRNDLQREQGRRIDWGEIAEMIANHDFD